MIKLNIKYLKNENKNRLEMIFLLTYSKIENGDHLF